MNIELMNFQKRAINALMQYMASSTNREIILKSPTGSGKTIILTKFMSDYLNDNAHTVFVWLTPGKGNLEEQSKKKMDIYIHNSQTKLLTDVMTGGFEENDACFINWEKLTKKSNNALKDGERDSFYNKIDKAFDEGLQFKIIIDESHQNFTAKADEVIQLFHADKIIRCSATPKENKHADLVEISTEEVIAEGLIKKLLIINEDFPRKIDIDTSDQTEYLLDKALSKHAEIKSKFVQRGLDINPLIIVQLPNSSDLLLDKVESYFEQQGYTYESGNLGIWMADRHENLENIEENNNKVSAVIIKQAIATGWDCPRAQILVKLRDNMDETFEVQTIGRIRRMPEAKHYEDDVLDCCYLYTFDSKFTQGVKTSLGKDALDAVRLFLKNEYKSFSLIKENRTMITDARDPRKLRTFIVNYYKEHYGLTNDKAYNKKKLEANGYVFGDEIIKKTYTGETANESVLFDKNNTLDTVQIRRKVNTHIDGREFHKHVGIIGKAVHLEYENARAIVMMLFGDKTAFHNKLLDLPVREIYAFVINNIDKMCDDFRDASAIELSQGAIGVKDISEKEFRIPQTLLFTYDADSKVQSESHKNVYNGYLMSAAPRSTPERDFEKLCERSNVVDWFYKNGDKGDEYFSIVYQDNSGAQKLFYPDYILSIKGEIWIIETKGGFTRTGKSEDIDIFTHKKFNVLRAYLDKHNLHGGVVRKEDASGEYCICQYVYSNDINSDSWVLLNEIM